MASTRPAGENSTTRSWPVSATQMCPVASVAMPAGWSRFLPKVATRRPDGEYSARRSWPVSATQISPAGSAATPPGSASVCCPNARRKGGACASGPGADAQDAAVAVRASADDPEVNTVATSMPKPTRAISRGRRPRRRDKMPIDQQSNPSRPVIAKRLGRLGRDDATLSFHGGRSGGDLPVPQGGRGHQGGYRGGRVRGGHPAAFGARTGRTLLG